MSSDVSYQLVENLYLLNFASMKNSFRRSTINYLADFTSLWQRSTILEVREKDEEVNISKSGSQLFTNALLYGLTKTVLPRFATQHKRTKTFLSNLLALILEDHE